MKKLLTILLIFIASISLAQTVYLKLTNASNMIMKSGSCIVINGTNTNAISSDATSKLVSEEQINKIYWTIGTGTGTYIVPFKNSAGVSVAIEYNITSAGVGNGNTIFSTGPTNATQKMTSTTLYPPPVTNMNNAGVDNSANVVDRFWFVTYDATYTINPSGTYKFYYADADIVGLTEANLQAQYWHNTNNNWVLPPIGTVTVASNFVGSIPSNSNSSVWTLVDKTTPLPIELLYFNVECQANNLLFKWTTASESNSNNFFIEKSADAINWGAIKMVSAQGNSNTLHEYSVSYPFQDEHYYRLTEIDYDGAYQQSNIVYSECDNVIVDVTISPNPTNATTKVRYSSYSEEPYNIIIYDQIGKTIYEKNHTIDVIHDVNLENYSPGIYTIKIYNSHGIYTNKIIKL